MLRDWLPVLVVLYLYDLSRGVADTLGMPVHVTEPLAADLAMFGVLPTEWLQDRLYDPADVHWWDVGAAFVYFSHFFVAWVVACVLYLHSRRQWLRFVTRLVALSFAGLATYVLYPAAPPWLAARLGEAPAVEPDLGARLGGGRAARRGPSGGDRADLGQRGGGGSLVTRGVRAVGRCLPVAIGPIHVGSRWLLAAYPVAMGFTLVYTGEHYVVDVLLGWLYVVVVLAASRRMPSGG